jgi:hypothetical protein
MSSAAPWKPTAVRSPRPRSSSPCRPRPSPLSGAPSGTYGGCRGQAALREFPADRFGLTVPEHPDSIATPPSSSTGRSRPPLAFLGLSPPRRPAQARRPQRGAGTPLLVPSGTSLLGLVKHLTHVEIYWLQKRFAGLDVVLDQDSFTPRRRRHHRRGRSSATSRRPSRPTTSPGPRPIQIGRWLSGRHGLTLRWVLAHVIEETARHAGHADILRELLDGATGR